MKPLFILLTVVSSFFAKTSSATDDISPAVVKSFQSTFATAKEASWTMSSNMYKVQFILNDQTVTAFYSVDGKLQGVSRNVSSFQLPVLLQAELKNEYAQFWISDLFELSLQQGTDYYVTLEDANSKIILKSIGGNSWTTYQKTRK